MGILTYNLGYGVRGSVNSDSPLDPIEVTALPALTKNSPATGQVVMAETGTLIQLPSASLINGVILTAYSQNSGPLSIGNYNVSNVMDGTGGGYILEPGCSVSAAVDNLSRIYVNGTAGDILSYMGS